jgi:CBS domain-containing protein
MTVASILNEKGRNVVTVDGEMTIGRVCSILAEKRIGAAVIVDGGQGVQGIVSERDIVRIIARDGGAALDQPASGVMTRDVVTCGEEETIGSLMEKMTAGKFRHLPVINNGRLTGIISIGDVVKRRIAEAEMDAQAMREYIAAG